MNEGREGKEEKNGVVGDAMWDVRVFLVRGECGEDINAMVSGEVIHVDEGCRVNKKMRANVLKKCSRSERPESNK
jgi:hypothetical protein